MKTEQKFQIGTIVATPGAINVMSEGGGDITMYLVMRHATGDYGDLCPEDVESNEHSIKNGGMILSSYTMEGQTILGGRAPQKLWVITDPADNNGVRHTTTILLPEEY